MKGLKTCDFVYLLRLLPYIDRRWFRNITIQSLKSCGLALEKSTLYIMQFFEGLNNELGWLNASDFSPTPIWTVFLDILPTLVMNPSPSQFTLAFPMWIGRHSRFDGHLIVNYNWFVEQKYRHSEGIENQGLGWFYKDHFWFTDSPLRLLFPACLHDWHSSKWAPWGWSQIAKFWTTEPSCIAV